MFQLKAFGGLALSSDAAPLPASAHQRKRLTLLVLLAAAGREGVSRERLLAHLWPDSSPERAQHALDQLLYATRRDLGRESVRSDGGRLRLDPAGVWSDIAEFHARLDREAWEEAAALYVGPFLDGVHPGGGTELEQWVDAQRAVLEELFVEGLEKLAGAAAEGGDVEAALSWWRRRADNRPFDARGARALVQALIRAGDRHGAVRYARTYGSLVRQQLNVDPDPEVLALAERWQPEAARRPDAHGEAKAAAVDGTPRKGTAPASSGDPAQPAPVRAGSPTTAETGTNIAPGPTRRSGVGAWKVALTICVAGALLVSAITSRRASSLPASPVEAGSVAVLPFEDLSGDGSAEYLGDGISEELIHRLAQVPDLRVAARTSAFVFKGRHQDIRSIARALGVSTVLEGSLRRDRDRLRVTAQLIDAATGYNLWSGSFDRPMSDALSIQDEMADSIVGILRPRLARHAVVGSPSPEKRRAYHLYLQGRFAWNRRTEASLRQAVGLFEQAITEDPAYGAAHAGLADAYDALVDGGFEPAESGYGRAEVAALRAIALDSTLAEGHASLGHIRVHRWQWAEAERDFRRALELNPGYAAAYAYSAMPLVMQGRFDEGLDRMRRAQTLDPLALNTHERMGWLLFLAGRHEEAVDQLEAVIAMDSTSVPAHARLGLSLVELGRHEEGIRSLERAVGLGGDYHRSALPMLGWAYAKAGRREDAERILEDVEPGIRAGSVNPYYAAALMAVIGDENGAFDLLDHAFRTSRGCLIDVGVDPMMRPLRGDPRYTALVEALGVNLLERGS